MKTKNLRHSIGGVMAGLFLLALGCSDGVLPSQTQEVPPNLAQPACTSFTATPAEVERGGSVTLAWEVELADKVVITAGGDNAFRYETTDQISGNTVAANIQQNTLFILTATNSSLYPPECTTDEEGNVTCPAPEEETEEVAAGGMTVGKAEGEEEEEGGEDGEEASTPAPTMCRRQVQVTVKATLQPLSIESFTAEDSEIGPNETGRTVLHWQVVPEEAVVTFSSTSGDLLVMLGPDCAINGNLAQIEREEDEVEVLDTYPASGCASVEVSETTTYTLTATLAGEEPQRAMVTIVVAEEEPEAPPAPVAQPDCISDIQISYPPSPVFSGEAVTIGWSIAEPTASLITSAKIVVVVMEEDEPVVAETIEEIDLSGGTDHASVAARVGLVVQFIAADGSVSCDPAVGLRVASFNVASGAKAVKVVDDSSDTDGAVYVGHDLGGFNNGFLRVTHLPEDNHLDIDFWSPFKLFDDINGDARIFNLGFMNEDIETFPVHAIAKTASGRLLVATTGVILYENLEPADENDPPWKALVALRRTERADAHYEGQHSTCLGQTQTGRESFRGDVVGLSRVCDMEIHDGRLYAATDRGLFYMDNVEGFINTGEGRWVGNSAEENNPTLEKVANDVLLAGSDKYVATSVGLFKNDENILDSVNATSVAVASAGSETRIVVGSTDGVYVRRGGEWGLTQEGVMYGVAIDPYDVNTVFAAGANGFFYVSRDGGVTFTEVAVEGLVENVNSVAVLYSGDPREEAVNYAVYLASDSGIFRANLADVVMGEVTENPEPAESEETESAGEVQGGDPDAGQTPDGGGSGSQEGFSYEAVITQP